MKWPKIVVANVVIRQDSEGRYCLNDQFVRAYDALFDGTPHHSRHDSNFAPKFGERKTSCITECCVRYQGATGSCSGKTSTTGASRQCAPPPLFRPSVPRLQFAHCHQWYATMTAGLEMEISKTEFALVVQEAVERGVATALSLRPRPSSVNFEQAAEMLCLSSKTVSTMVRDGRIRANKIGRIPVSEIDRALSASNPGSGRRSAK